MVAAQEACSVNLCLGKDLSELDAATPPRFQESPFELAIQNQEDGLIWEDT